MVRKPPSKAEYIKQYSREYKAWSNARSKAKERGIEVTNNFNDFYKFIAVIGKRPSEKHSLDRINNNAGYDLKNIRWATKKEQSNNRSNTIFLKYEGQNKKFIGQEKPLTDWARDLGVKAQTLRRRKRDRWSDTETIDGAREKKALSFHQMSKYQLENFKPWPEENSNELEIKFLKDRGENETRFAFLKRNTLGPLKKKIYSMAEDLEILNIRYLNDNERITYADMKLKEKGPWIFVGEVTKKQEKKFNKLRKEYIELRKVINVEETKWNDALKKHYLAYESKNVSGSLAKIIKSQAFKKLSEN